MAVVGPLQYIKNPVLIKPLCVTVVVTVYTRLHKWQSEVLCNILKIVEGFRVVVFIGNASIEFMLRFCFFAVHTVPETVICFKVMGKAERKKSLEVVRMLL